MRPARIRPPLPCGICYALHLWYLDAHKQVKLAGIRDVTVTRAEMSAQKQGVQARSIKSSSKEYQSVARRSKEGWLTYILHITLTEVRKVAMTRAETGAHEQAAPDGHGKHASIWYLWKHNCSTSLCLVSLVEDSSSLYRQSHRWRLTPESMTLW